MFRDGAARLLVFGVGSERFAVELSAVAEVIATPAVQPVPDSPPTLLGITMLRGELVPIHDLRPLLHAGAGSMGGVLLFSRDGRTTGLAIDDIDDALVIQEHELRPAPGTGGADALLVGLVRRDSDLIAVLDVEALLAAVRMDTEGQRA
ncbi:MAG TPA: chemotaxis protein CheW [Gemmatimonadaceae bacterium]|jgi:purine-binding chemotaxis protein CheW|nr:chemotaxis protein CheW [Gemmatimonadaceae bacterium]